MMTKFRNSIDFKEWDTYKYLISIFSKIFAESKLWKKLKYFKFSSVKNICIDTTFDASWKPCSNEVLIVVKSKQNSYCNYIRSFQSWRRAAYCNLEKIFINLTHDLILVCFIEYIISLIFTAIITFVKKWLIKMM